MEGWDIGWLGCRVEMECSHVGLEIWIVGRTERRVYWKGGPKNLTHHRAWKESTVGLASFVLVLDRRDHMKCLLV